MTPCISSRDKARIAPSVTPMTALPILFPAAKALTESPGIAYTGGGGQPDASAISATIFSSRLSSADAESADSSRPPMLSATAAPPPAASAAIL